MNVNTKNLTSKQLIDILENTGYIGIDILDSKWVGYRSDTHQHVYLAMSANDGVDADGQSYIIYLVFIYLSEDGSLHADFGSLPEATITGKDDATADLARRAEEYKAQRYFENLCR